MALDTYQNLKASIENWSHRDDVGDFLDDFIDICEIEMYSGVGGQIRVRDMITTETSAMSDSVQYQALPTDFLETKRLDVTLSSERYTIDFRTTEQMGLRSGTGTPAYYTVTSQLEYDIQPDQAYVTNHIHYAKLTALSAAEPTNAILTKYPNVYVYGVLWALFQYGNDAEEEAKYYSKFIAAIVGANASDSNGQYGVSAQKIKRGRNP